MGNIFLFIRATLFYGLFLQVMELGCSQRIGSRELHLQSYKDRRKEVTNLKSGSGE